MACPEHGYGSVIMERHETTTDDEKRAMNPYPIGEHIHAKCSQCDYDTITFPAIEVGRAFMGFDPERPTSGPIPVEIRENR